jgi:hypothetical protein
VVQDSAEPHTPDSIFPNNWVSFHQNSTICLYPMFAVNRRMERKQNVLQTISTKFIIAHTIDLSYFEEDKKFLEGTGSMVLDREHKVAYACLSPRTDLKVLHEFCSKMGYQAVSFNAVDGNGQAIYHTNVMMCMADTYVVICADAIPEQKEKEEVLNTIRKYKKRIILISMEQMNHFAGNMLQVENMAGEKLCIMSSQAFQSLSTEQVAELTSFNKIIHSKLETIERNGGGSARCMMAEVHLPLRIPV